MREDQKIERAMITDRLALYTRQSAQEGRRLGKVLRDLDWHSAGLRSRSTR